MRGESDTFSRRDVVKGMMGMAGAAAISSVDTNVLGPEHYRQKSTVELLTSTKKEDTARLSLRLHRAIKEIMPYEPKLETLQDAYAFSREYVPQLASDGLLFGWELEDPPIEIHDYRKSDGASGFLGFLGHSACQQEPSSIWINSRLFEPYSPWKNAYEEASGKIVKTTSVGVQVGALAHELSHSNNVSCDMKDPDGTESTTQLVAMNTLGSMSMRNMRIALPGFLHIMSDITHIFLYEKCLREDMDDKHMLPNINRLDPKKGLGWYGEHLKRLPDGADAYAGLMGLLHSLEGKKLGGHLKTVRSYWGVPYLRTAEAMRDRDCKTRAINLPTVSKKLDMYATKFVLSNLNALVDNYKQ